MKIIIDNSTTKIVDMTMDQYRKLKNYLLYKVKSFKNVYYRTLLNKDGSFPTGLLHHFNLGVKESLIQIESVTDKRIEPKSLKGFPMFSAPYPLYPHQKLAIARFRAFKRGIISAPTGMGKSAIIAGAINEIKVKTLIVTPSVALREQMLSYLKQCFSGNSVGRMDKNKIITVENIDALPQKSNKYKDFGLVIIDEFHHSAAKMYRKLNDKCWNNIYYRLGLTATPFRADDDEKILLESVLSKVIYKVSQQTAVSSNYVVPLEFYYLPIKFPHKNEYMTYKDAYKEHIIRNDSRNAAICDLSRSLSSSNCNHLILVKEIEHGKLLQQELNIPFANGEDENSLKYIEQFSIGQIKGLIATSIVGEGVDTKAAEYVILAGGVGKSKVQQMQNIGRVVRNWNGKKTGKVIVFKDLGHRWFKNHYNQFEKMVEQEYNTKLVNLLV